MHTVARVRVPGALYRLDPVVRGHLHTYFLLTVFFSAFPFVSPSLPYHRTERNAGWAPVCCCWSCCRAFKLAVETLAKTLLAALPSWLA